MWFKIYIVKVPGIQYLIYTLQVFWPYLKLNVTLVLENAHRLLDPTYIAYVYTSSLEIRGPVSTPEEFFFTIYVKTLFSPGT